MSLTVAQRVLSGAEAILRLCGDFAPVPGLSPAADILGVLLIVCQSVETNKYDANLLRH
jgi:hypothetical protein